jgi:hypothetical protein
MEIYNKVEKFEWMYGRISNKKAKDIAKKWYDEALQEIERE